jgi:hypothetical protein
MLKHFCDEHQTDWDEYIPWALLAYRASRHSVHHFSPNEVAFGFQLELPVDSLAQTSSRGTATLLGIPKNVLVSQALERWHDVKAFVNRYRILARDNYRERYDSSVVLPDYYVGQLVWLYTPSVKKGMSRKLTKMWRGPFRIFDRKSPVSYSLLVPRKRKLLKQIVHVQRLKPFFARGEEPYAAPTIIDESDPFDPAEDSELLEEEQAELEHPYNSVSDSFSKFQSTSNKMSQAAAEAPSRPRGGLPGSQFPISNISHTNSPGPSSPRAVAPSSPLDSPVSPLGSSADSAGPSVSSSRIIPSSSVPPLDPPAPATEVTNNDFPEVDLELSPHQAEDFDHLSDLYTSLEILSTNFHDSPNYSIARIKKELKMKLGQGSGFIRSTSLQRQFEKEITKLKSRDDIAGYLKSLLRHFPIRFHAELSRVQESRSRRRALRAVNLIFTAFHAYPLD